MELAERVYDCIQRCCGLARTQARLAPHVAETARGCVLDVGAGTGLYRTLVSPGARYCWLDVDRAQLARFRRRHPEEHAVLGDATCLPIATRSIDLGLCVAVSHHLSGPQLSSLFRELARVVCGRLVFLDAVRSDSSWISRLLWRADRGAFPRRAECLLAAIEEQFIVDHVEQYALYHRYVLCVARPRARG